MKRLLSLVFAALLALAGVATAAGKLQQRFFLSPSGNISCELDYTPGGTPTIAYCEAFKPGVSVTMSASGKIKTCHGTHCLSNPPENVTTLRYGKTVALGPFRCTSLTSAMDCRLTATGRGFSISRSGVALLATGPVTS
jgi:hypothetical protein